MKLSPASFRKIVVASAFYDIIVTAPFATPWTYELMMDFVGAIHHKFALTGQLPHGGTHEVMLANLLGSVVLVWSVYRLSHPTVRIGRYDGVARLLFSVWQINALLAGSSTLIVLFLAAEVMWGVLQFLPVLKTETDGGSES